MPDNSVECHLGRLIEKTDALERQLRQLLQVQEWQNEKLEKLTICKIGYDEALPDIEAQLSVQRQDIDELKRLRWRVDGGATVAAWVGGLVLTAIISLGAFVLNWAVGPKGPFHPS
jgi:hypothetical protein